MLAVLIGIIVCSVIFLVDVFISVLVLDKNDPLIYRVLTVRKRWNKIHQCDKCEKLSREYQQRIYKEVNGDERCPHCERYMYGYNSRKIREEEWMNSHPDCPKISFLGCVKINKVIKEIRKNNKLLKSQQFFEEYNNIKVDFDWIKNLQKKYK